MRVLVLLNPSSGTMATAEGDVAERLRNEFQSAGMQAEIVADKPPQLIEQAKLAAKNGYEAVIAGGGDGTLNAIANVVAGSTVAFGVLPLGTHNHFAKELSVPLELDEAVRALAHGRMENLDVAEVNGKLFLNFSAIGVHPAVVKAREEQDHLVKEAGRFGKIIRKCVKVIAGLLAFVLAISRLPLLAVRLTGGGQTHRRLTPSIIVCTNVHQMDVFGALKVSHPRRDQLNIYVAGTTTPFGMLRLFGRVLFRQLHSASRRDFQNLTAPELQIDLRRHKLPVSIDGEVMTLSTPLRYKIRRSGLKVIVP